MLLTADLYITASCSICRGTVIKNGEIIFQTSGKDAPAFLLSIYQHFEINYPKFYKMDSLSKLGWLAAEMLLKDSFDKSSYQPEETGLVLSNKNSSLDTDIRYYDTVKTIASPGLFVYTLPNIVMGEICIRHNFKGENDFFIFESFNAGFISQYVHHIFASGSLKACICGWVDIMHNDYEAVLMLVEQKHNETGILFAEKNIHQIYQTAHG